VDWLAESGFSVWQFLPFGPTGHGNSPYQLLSAFAGNPLFIDPDGLVDLGLLDPVEVAAARAGSADRVDYGAVITQHGELLRLAAARFGAGTPAWLCGEYRAFVDAHDALWLRDHALYATLKRFHDGAPWSAWPPGHRDRDPLSLAEWRDANAAAMQVERVIQFLFYRQWESLRVHALERGVALFGDVPIYLPHDCADAWARRELLALDDDGYPIEVAGVPPDYFSDEGQRWGNPLYDWQHHAADGYSWWVSRLRHAFETMDMVRLDHFRGFEAYWSIPADSSAREGIWRPGPGAALFAAIRAALGECQIVAEDLGIITDEVTALRRQFDLPGMQVLQFMVGEPEFDPASIGEDCVCYTGTHDNDTVVGWFHRSARRDPAALGELQRSVCERLGCDVHHVGDAMIRLAFGTAAELAIVPMQDVLGLDSRARMNMPGSVGDNWTWRLVEAQLDDEIAARMRAMIEASGRVAGNGAGAGCR
jgi:4-alpha-glucanotransferase